MTSRPRFVLWDIDQTLLDAGSCTRQAYAAAFHRATGHRLTQPWRFDGRTELAAAAEVLGMHGFAPEAELLAAFLELIVAELESRAAELAATGCVLPGAREALEAVAALPGTRQSVLTGNLYPLACLKLGLFGLADHIDTRIGAYGGDAVDRCDLPRHALDRAWRHCRRRYLGSETVIVGDTPRDVEAARAVGATAVGVATGAFSAADLRAAGAAVVLTDLSDTSAVLNAIGFS